MKHDLSQITSYLGAGYSLFWVESSEPRRALEQLSEELKNYERKDSSKYRLTIWDCTASGKQADPKFPVQNLSDEHPLTVKVVKNFHWFIESPQLIQLIENNVEVWKSQGQALVVISNKAKIPPELEKDFLVMEQSLPSEDDIVESVGHIVESTGGKAKMPEGDELNSVIKAGKGLARLEVENALARSFVTTGHFDPAMLNDHKAMAVERQGLLEVVRPDLTLDDIVGYDQIKEFCWPITEDTLGVLIFGPPGCGKTFFVYCLCGESGLPTFKLDSGKLFSKFQGESDRLVREAQEMISATGECNLIIDEFEKQFAGAGGDGNLDSGTTRRTAGKWLDFLEFKNRPKGVHVYGTCNSFRGIPPEYFRPGRWDSAPFFIDLPSRDEQLAIMNHYIEKYELDVKDSDRPKMDGWTGAEIEACARIAKIRGWTLKKASNFILAQSKTADAEINALREWAMGGDKWEPGKGRAIPASKIKVDNGDQTKRNVVKLDR
jgi:hypothetical protein